MVCFVGKKDQVKGEQKLRDKETQREREKEREREREREREIAC
jgi:hypothetical protein